MTRAAPLPGIRTFCVVARYLSFKDAADELCISASAVSHRIKELERQLGVRLFERGTRSLTITAAGRFLYDETDSLIRGVDLAARKLADQADILRLRIRLPAFFANEFFMPKFKRFVDLQPSMEIQVETTESDNGSARPGADVSIVVSDAPPDDSSAMPLFRLTLVPACSPDVYSATDGFAATSFDNAKLIVHKDWPRGWSDWANAAAVPMPRPRQCIHFDAISSIVDAAEQGLGVALVPIPLTEERFRSGALIQASSQVLDTNDYCYLMYRRDDSQRPEIQAFLSWALKEFVGQQIASTGNTTLLHDQSQKPENRACIGQR